MRLDHDVCKSFQAAKVFEENDGRIRSIDFSFDGKALVTSSLDDSINVYNCIEGTHQKKIFSKKYGADLVRFTHNTETVIYASTKENDVIRYLSLHDNSYIRYFSDHKARVTSLEMSPVNDTFISASQDKTVRLWDLRSRFCHGRLQASSRPVAAFDNEGVIFAVGLDDQHIKLYDSRNYEAGPFGTFRVDQPSPHPFTGLEFSPNGKHIAVSTAAGRGYILDSFKGTSEGFVGDETLVAGDHASFSFSPCSNFLVSGSRNGNVLIWGRESCNKVANLAAHHDAVNCAKFNPRYTMMATACSSLVFWLPADSVPTA